jgi:polygalacturonase
MQVAFGVRGIQANRYAITLIVWVLFLLMIQTADALELAVSVGDNIQEAIDRVSLAGGGTVHLGAGVHQISTPIRIRSNVILSGAGHKATTINTAKVINFVNNTVFDNGEGGIQARRDVTGSVTGCTSFNNKRFDFDLNADISQSANSTNAVEPSEETEK